jgi:hypothetical protein
LFESLLEQLAVDAPVLLLGFADLSKCEHFETPLGLSKPPLEARSLFSHSFVVGGVADAELVRRVLEAGVSCVSERGGVFERDLPALPPAPIPQTKTPAAPKTSAEEEVHEETATIFEWKEMLRDICNRQTAKKGCCFCLKMLFQTEFWTPDDFGPFTIRFLCKNFLV